jgi:hypothetical protein
VLFSFNHSLLLVFYMLSLQNSPTAGCKTTKRLLGRILVDGEFVTPQDLDIALKEQKKTNAQLGEILVRMGVLDPLELNSVLSIQHDLATPDEAVKLGSGVRLLLGELLLKARRISKAQLDYALMQQRQTGEKLGETLVRLGLLEVKELDAVLAFQQHQQGAAPVSEKLRLGEILVATNQITREQLESALSRQKLTKKKIGDLLIEAGYVQPEQVDQGLKLQQKLVTAALVAALSLSNAFVAREACSGTTLAATTKITIAAVVREHTSMKVLAQAQELVVTNTDVKRGYVEVSAAARINVKSNNPAGYLLTFEVIGGPMPFLNSMYVLVGGREVQLSPGGGWIPQPYIRGGVTTDVSCRFALSKDAQPGTYHWPLMISVLPM